MLNQKNNTFNSIKTKRDNISNRTREIEEEIKKQIELPQGEEHHLFD
jgi:hypothetical protein